MCHHGHFDGAGVDFLFPARCGLECKRQWPGCRSTNNWIGPAGSYAADLLFQVFGFAAFLLPMALAVLGWRWLKNRAINSQVATLVGYALMLLALPSLLNAVAFSGCARHRATGRNAGFVGFRRLALRLQSDRRKCRGGCAATDRVVHDHTIFFFWRARVGQRTERTAGRGGKVGHSAESAGSLACVARNAGAGETRRRLAETRISGRKPVRRRRRIPRTA